MRLLLIRHAIAEDPDAFRNRAGLDDAERPITRKGQSRMSELKKGGACLLRFPDALDAGKAEIEWLLRAGQLRRLARR